MSLVGDVPGVSPVNKSGGVSSVPAATGLVPSASTVAAAPSKGLFFRIRIRSAFLSMSELPCSPTGPQLRRRNFRLPQ